jgi:hypothetical protein
MENHHVSTSQSSLAGYSAGHIRSFAQSRRQGAKKTAPRTQLLALLERVGPALKRAA